jgi:hypothetical protein
MDGRLNRRSFIVGVPDPGVKERRVPLDFEKGQVRGGVEPPWTSRHTISEPRSGDNYLKGSAAEVVSRR